MVTLSGQERALPRSLETYFVRTLKLRAPQNVSLSRDMILDALERSERTLESVHAIGQAGNKNVWFIKFGDEEEVKRMSGRLLTFRNAENRSIGSATLALPYDEHVYVTYRLLWLPPGFKREKAQDLVRRMDPEADIVDSWYETMRRENRIRTGNICVKVKQLRNEKARIQSGIRTLVSGWEFIITRLGERRKCLLCDSDQHLKIACPRLGMSCKTCNGKYHLDTECSYAWKIKCGQEKEKAILDDILDAENEDDEEQQLVKPGGQQEPAGRGDGVEGREEMDTEDASGQPVGAEQTRGGDLTSVGDQAGRTNLTGDTAQNSAVARRSEVLNEPEEANEEEGEQSSMEQQSSTRTGEGLTIQSMVNELKTRKTIRSSFVSTFNVTQENVSTYPEDSQVDTQESGTKRNYHELSNSEALSGQGQESKKWSPDDTDNGSDGETDRVDAGTEQDVCVETYRPNLALKTGNISKDQAKTHANKQAQNQAKNQVQNQVQNQAKNRKSNGQAKTNNLPINHG